MIANANVKKIVAASSHRVWQAIRSIGGLDLWFPVIASCHVEGEGVGAIRILGLAGGGEMRDRIVEIDDSEHRLRYERFQSPFPVESYHGTVEIRAASDQSSEIFWKVQVDVAADQKDALVPFIESALSDGIEGLERELQLATSGSMR